jgi:hypothetical protein
MRCRDWIILLLVCIVTSTLCSVATNNLLLRAKGDQMDLEMAQRRAVLESEVAQRRADVMTEFNEEAETKARERKNLLNEQSEIRKRLSKLEAK